MRRTLKTCGTALRATCCDTGNSGPGHPFFASLSAAYRLPVALAAVLGFCLSLLVALPAQAETRDYKPKPAPMPGGVAVIELPVSLGTEEAPMIYFQGQKVFVMNRPYNSKSDNRWIAWVGIPLDTRPGKVPLVIEQPNGRTREIMINVRPGTHSRNFIVTQNEAAKNLTAAQQKRIRQEEARLQRLISGHSGKAPDTRTFVHPTRGSILRPFGDQTFLNGERLESHNGIDLSGQRANAPADGTVVLIDDLFYGGKTVVIDHGRGLYTQYSHLADTNFRIREGQRIRRGEEIGKIGTSGHHIEPGKDYAAPVRRPHLHWGVSLNGAFVDPKLFLLEAR